MLPDEPGGLLRGLLAEDGLRWPRWILAAGIDRLGRAIADGDVTISRGERRQLCRKLNSERLFDLTVKLSDGLRMAGVADVEVERSRAQAQIDSGALDDAEESLAKAETLLAKGKQFGDENDQVEIDGLRGRLAKVRFVASRAPADLEEARRRYHDAFDHGGRKSYWLAINALALGEAHKRMGGGGNAALDVDIDALLELTLRAAESEPNNPWPIATLAEIRLAMGQCDSALEFAAKLCMHPRTTQFVLASFLRQLHEVWSFPVADPCTGKLIGIVDTALAKQGIVMMSRPQEKDWKEKNFSGVGLFPVEVIRRMLDRCGSVACICRRNGSRLGTGFLVDRREIWPGDPAGLVLVTNAHVLSATVKGAIDPEDALVSFELEADAQGRPVFHEVDTVLMSSEPGELGVVVAGPQRLDVTIATLKSVPAGAKGIPLSLQIPQIDDQAKAYVVGHPLGSGLQISLHDSRLLDADDVGRLVHYYTPTEPGSSGSPVFNEAWQVIAVHHGGSTTTPKLRGGGNYAANEGICFAAVCRALR